eukprot:sb/3468444/
MPPLEDTFVNGLAYPSDIKLFTGFVDKAKHAAIIQGYIGNDANINSVYRETQGLSWETIRKDVRDMFTSEMIGVEGVKQSFYANDDSCIFKYFVLPSEPQAVFVWILGLAIHCLCFVIVVVCHLFILILSTRESAAAPQNALDRNRQLQSIISTIILTDFCCWFPFLMCCVLHTAEVVDMTEWYATFSIAIIPLNSVMNPILYTDLYKSIMEWISNKISVLVSAMTMMTEKWSNVVMLMRKHYGNDEDQENHEEIEMDES